MSGSRRLFRSDQTLGGANLGPWGAVPSAALDDDAFRPGAPEVQLHDEATVLMASGALRALRTLKNERGVLHLTNDRLFFNDQRFDTSLGGLAGTLSEALEKLRKEHPPMIDLALAEIIRVAHVTKLTVRDILVVETAAGESRFAQRVQEPEPVAPAGPHGAPRSERGRRRRGRLARRLTPGRDRPIG